MMAHPFKPYEIHVLEKLLVDEYSPKQLSALLEGSSLLQIEYTDYGFYISVQNPGFGKERRVYSDRTIGRLHDKDAGFVAFLEDGHLTLEIFPCDGETLPAMFRDGNVKIIGSASNNQG
ncbi:MAG: hypothetical protein JF612_00150 [Planctomycetia bacterium]|nr:hypothetical protein [Planctomycetia bacterium]